MGISYRTAGAYLFQARRRLKVRSTAQLIVMMERKEIPLLIGDKQ
jgi:DNA-binding CsgD family transcriptional regulator